MKIRPDIDVSVSVSSYELYIVSLSMVSRLSTTTRFHIPLNGVRCDFPHPALCRAKNFHFFRVPAVFKGVRIISVRIRYQMIVVPLQVWAI